MQKQAWKLAGPARSGTRQPGSEGRARLLLARAGRLARRAAETGARAGLDQLEPELA